MSSFCLKILAAIIMLIDHIGLCLFPNVILLRIIGRLSFPIFAFQVTIGYQKTSNKLKYIFRMLIFALVSQIPFMIFRMVSDISIYSANIGFTFLIALICLYFIDLSKEKKNYLLGLVVIPLLFLSYFINCDYTFYGVLLVIFLYLFNPKKNFFVSAISIFILTLVCVLIGEVSTIQLYSILALLPIALYNGKKGTNSKYFFYIFYPLHLLLISFVKYFFM